MSEQRLTPAQITFLLSFKSKDTVPVFPGTDTRVARNLAVAGMITLQNDYATITQKGREYIAT